MQKRHTSCRRFNICIAHVCLGTFYICDYLYIHLNSILIKQKLNINGKKIMILSLPVCYVFFVVTILNIIHDLNDV